MSYLFGKDLRQVNSYTLIPGNIYRSANGKIKINRCVHKLNGVEFLIKRWKIYSYNLHGESILDNKYYELFDNEVKMFNKVLNSENGRAFIPNLFERQYKAAYIKNGKTQYVAYQIFETIKYGSLESFHRPNAYLPHDLCVRLFKKTVQFTNLMHSLNLSIFTLDTSLIFISQSFTPIFLNLMHTRSLTYNDIYNQTILSTSFMCPEMYQNPPKFDTMKSDAFQLGIIALYFLLEVGGCCLTHNKPDDKIYKFVFQENWPAFWNRIACQNKCQNIKRMVEGLICFDERLRLETEQIPLTQWWKSNHKEPDHDVLDKVLALRKQKLEERKNQQKKRKMQSQPIKNSKLHSILFKKQVSNRGVSVQQTTLSTLEYDTKALTGQSMNWNCYYWYGNIHDIYNSLWNTCETKFNSVTEVKNKFKFLTIYVDELYSIFIRISLYESEEQDLTVVKYELLSDNKLHQINRFQSLIDELERTKQDSEL